MLEKIVYKMPKSIRKMMRTPYSVYAKSKHLDKDIRIQTDYAILIANPMTYIGCSLYNRGVYEPPTSRIIEHFLEEGMTAIDVGASNGVHSLRMSKCVGKSGRVYAFEPSKERFDYLERNITLNNRDNIIPEMKSLSDRHKHGKVQERGFVRMDGKKHDVVVNTVEIVKFDDYVKKNMIKKVDFIKIDTDGYEYQIIKGAEDIIKRDKPVIIIEMRNEFYEGKTSEDLVLLLSSLGYTFFKEKSMNQYICEEAVIDDVENEVKNVLCVIDE